MRDYITGILSKGEERRYQWGVMMHSRPDIFVPVSIAEMSGVYICHADVTGLKRLREIGGMEACEGVEFIKNAMRGMHAASDQYIMPWDYCLGANMLFYDTGKKKPRLVYCPYKYNADAERNIGASIVHNGRKIAQHLSEIVYEHQRGIWAEVTAVLAGPSRGINTSLKQLTKLQQAMPERE